jgi:hypothetical protein
MPDKYIVEHLLQFALQDVAWSFRFENVFGSVGDDKRMMMLDSLPHIPLVF